MAKILLALLFSVTVFAQNIPSVNSPVYDEVGWLGKYEKMSLEQSIRSLHNGGGPQIQVMFVRNLQGVTVEEYSIKAAEKIQMGSAKEDNGLFLIVAQEERKIRIEVGNGIEGQVTDYDSFKYIKTILTPNFKAKRFYEGTQIFIQEIAKKFKVNIQKKVVRKKRRAGGDLISMAIFFAFIISWLIHAIFKNILVRTVITTAVSGVMAYFVFGLVIKYILIMGGVGFLLGLAGFNNSLNRASGGYYGSNRGWSSHSGSGWSSGGSGWSGGGGGFSGGGASGDF